MKLSLKLTSVFIGLTLTAFVAQAGSCCGAGKDSDKDNAVPTASVAMATPTVECAAGEKGFFARLFSRFGSSRTATVAKSEECSACPAKAGASLAVLNKECDKDESKSKGCSPCTREASIPVAAAAQ